MNLWVSMEDEGAFTSGEEAFARSLSAISGHIEELGGTLPVYALTPRSGSKIRGR